MRDSLPWALGEVLTRAGVASERAEAALRCEVALGLALHVAQPTPAPLPTWHHFEQDASLSEAASALGIVVRELHPPAASDGLEESAEFVDHFRDSYVPLIDRALGAGQQALAWGGWRGSCKASDARRERWWGLITGHAGAPHAPEPESAAARLGDGSRYVGWCFWPDLTGMAPAPNEGAAAQQPTNAALLPPAYQVYVVEAVEPSAASDARLMTGLARSVSARAAESRYGRWLDAWSQAADAKLEARGWLEHLAHRRRNLGVWAGRVARQPDSAQGDASERALRELAHALEAFADRSAEAVRAILSEPRWRNAEFVRNELDRLTALDETIITRLQRAALATT